MYLLAHQIYVVSTFNTHGATPALMERRGKAGD